MANMHQLIALKLLLKQGSQIDALAEFVKLICKTLDTYRDKRIIFIRFLSFLSVFYFYLCNQYIYFCIRIIVVLQAGNDVALLSVDWPRADGYSVNQLYF